MDQVQLARSIAKDIHCGQLDKGGQPYFLHVEAVADSVAGERQKAAAYLHDSLEDTNLTADDLRKYGVNQDVIRLIQLLTRGPGESYQDYIRRLSRDPEAGKIKLADLRHNADLSRIPQPTEKDRQRRKKYMKFICYLENL
ncbi:GTP pyrophosphokinase [Faecalibaculum rodentium]|uniref:GTP pyrophosphokinase n=1 Tax=Faecalibaculum rodentium TaxID=1702221 RepID=UPI0026707E6E|nr:GTP pyrophosphokinase [Faecalibaculum rodentium]